MQFWRLVSSLSFCRQQLGIVASGNVRGTDGIGIVKQPAELDPLVAPNTGVGCSAGTVVSSKGINNLLEVAGEIEWIKRNIEPIGDPPSIECITDTAAALMARPAGRRFDNGERAGRGQRRLAVSHEDTDALMSRLNQQGSGDARIDTSGHGYDDTRHEAGSWRRWMR